MGQAIGIDLGTTYSAVAVMGQDGKPMILPNSEGHNTTPSVVLFPETSGAGEEPIVGEMAKRSAATAPLDVVKCVKRQMGDPNWRAVTANGNSYSAEEVSAIILKRLKLDAETTLGEEVTDAVITVPAYFDDTRRVATQQAGKIAGLNVLRVLNEPTAAALSYGLEQGKNGTVLVYDLGGGTFDVTIMDIQDGEFNVLATDGNRNLGGFDFDNRIANYIVEQLLAAGESESIRLDDLLMAQISEKAELAKISLSMVMQTNVLISVNRKQHKICLTRNQFEEMSHDLMQTTLELVEDAMENAGKQWSDIDHLLLIGGSTRMPMVRNMMTKVSGKKPELGVNPDEAVALGAAIQAYAAMSHEQTADPMPVVIPHVSDVTSQALGVILLNDDNQDENFVIIPKNAKIPAKGETRAFTVVDQQKEIRVQVTQGDDRDVRYVTVIGSSCIPIPSYPKGAPFRVAYAYDIDQTVFVELYDDTAQKKVGTFEVDRPLNMDNKKLSEAMQRVGDMPV